VLENVEPPTVLLGPVDADVIGHDINNEADLPFPRRDGEPRKSFGSAKGGKKNGGGIGDVVAVCGTLDGGQDRRQVDVRHPEFVEVVQYGQGIGEGEAVAAHLQPIRRQHARCHVSGGLTEHQQ